MTCAELEKVTKERDTERESALLWLRERDATAENWRAAVKERDSARAERDSLTESWNEALSGEASVTKDRDANLKLRIRLEECCGMLRANNAKIENELQSSRAREDTLSKELAKVKAELDNVVGQRDQAWEEVVDRNATINRLKTSLANLRSDNADLMEQKAKCSRCTPPSTLDLDVAKARLSDAQRTIDRQACEIDRLRAAKEDPSLVSVYALVDGHTRRANITVDPARASVFRAAAAVLRTLL